MSVGCCGHGGPGAYVEGTFATTPGELIRITVGAGQNFPGIIPGSDACGAGGLSACGILGGGRSAIHRLQAVTGIPIVIAMAGGGSGSMQGACGINQESSSGQPGTIAGACSDTTPVDPVPGGGGGWCGGTTSSWRSATGGSSYLLGLQPGSATGLMTPNPVPLVRKIWYSRALGCAASLCSVC